MASEPSPLIVILIINDYPSHHSHVSKNIVYVAYWRERHEVLVCNQGCLRSCDFPGCGVAVLKMRMITNLFKFLPSAIIVSYYGFWILVQPAFLLPLVFSSLVCVYRIERSIKSLWCLYTIVTQSYGIVYWKELIVRCWVNNNDLKG